MELEWEEVFDVATAQVFFRSRAQPHIATWERPRRLPTYDPLRPGAPCDAYDPAFPYFGFAFVPPPPNNGVGGAAHAAAETRRRRRDRAGGGAAGRCRADGGGASP